LVLVATQLYEKTKKQLDDDISRMLGSLAGRKTAEERRTEAALLENFVGDLPQDAEKEMQEGIHIVQASIEEEQARSESAMCNSSYFTQGRGCADALGECTNDCVACC
jgi:hypothetical protein